MIAGRSGKRKLTWDKRRIRYRKVCSSVGDTLSLQLCLAPRIGTYALLSEQGGDGRKLQSSGQEKHGENGSGGAYQFILWQKTPIATRASGGLQVKSTSRGL